MKYTSELFTNISYQIKCYKNKEQSLYRSPEVKVYITEAFNFPMEFFFFSCLLSLFRAAPPAYGASQGRGWNGAIAAGLHHSYSNARSLTH